MSWTSEEREATRTVVFDAVQCDCCGTKVIGGLPRGEDGREFDPEALPASLREERSGKRTDDWLAVGRVSGRTRDAILHFCPKCASSAFAALKGLRK